MNQDDELVGRLLDAARNDTATDEAQRQALLHARVVGAGPAGGPGGGAGLRWGRLAALGGGVAVLALAASSVLRSPPPPAPPLAGSPSAVIVPASAVAAVETPSPVVNSVWALPSITPAAQPAAPRPSTGTDEADTLAADLAALEAARHQLRVGNPSAALGALDELDRRSPRSRVRDEATVLRIEVLVALARGPEARRLADRFLADHPSSIYRPRINQSLGERTP